MGRSFVDAVTGLGLVTGPFYAALMSAAVAALVALFVLRRDRVWWTRCVPLALAVTTVLLVGSGLWIDAVQPWPDALPAAVWAWAGAGELAIVLAALGWRHRSWRRRVVTVGAVVLALVGAADGINAVYGAYPTVAAALQLPPTDSSPNLARVRSTIVTDGSAAPGPLWAWHSTAAPPAHGAVFSVSIPPTRSSFAARSAWVYAPPVYRLARHPQLPVLLLLGGQPGGPRDWLDGGRLAERMDAWAAAHAGLAPVVVMPDVLGRQFANPLCMDSALGQADTYLSADVVSWVTSHLDVERDPKHWAVGGFSSGGTCALQLATAHPGLFPTFFDASGQQGPTLGNRRQTIKVTFHGDSAAFVAVSPLHELGQHRYPSSAGYFAVGAHDPIYGPQQAAVVRAARASGMTVVDVKLAGGHSWHVWGPALSAAMPWLAARLGLLP